MSYDSIAGDQSPKNDKLESVGIVPRWIPTIDYDYYKEEEKVVVALK